MTKIIPQKTKMDSDNVLDLIGRDFNFDHSKGIAEFIKNSDDAYIINQDKYRPIILIIDSTSPTNLTKISVLDFVGMSHQKIMEGFIFWFNNAASQLSAEGKKIKQNVRGGHGNGGKFYMRQMFKKSMLKTYYKGHYSEFGFTEKKEYGFNEAYEDISIAPKAAMITSGVSQILSNLIRCKNIELDHIQLLINEIEENKRGFTLIEGISPVKKAGQEKKIDKMIGKLIANPQASQIIDSASIHYLNNRVKKSFLLKNSPIPPKEGFENPIKVPLPSSITFNGKDYKLFNNSDNEKYFLELNSSNDPLVGKNRWINRIDFLGDVGVIASYPIHKINNSDLSDFIYGSCNFSFIDKEYVKNDRTTFISDDEGLIAAILDWVSIQVDNLSNEIKKNEKDKRRDDDLSEAANFNEVLNKWKNKFLDSLSKGEITIGSNPNIEGLGGDEDSDLWWEGDKKSGKKTKKKQKTGNKGGLKKKKGSKFPTIFLSNHDLDPKDNYKTQLSLSPRHPVVHQRPFDSENNIYWINTSKAFASNIIDKYGVNSYEWKQYNFERVKDVVLVEAIKICTKKDVDIQFDTLKNIIDETVGKIFDEDNLINLIVND